MLEFAALGPARRSGLRVIPSLSKGAASCEHRRRHAAEGVASKNQKFHLFPPLPRDDDLTVAGLRYASLVHNVSRLRFGIRRTSTAAPPHHKIALLHPLLHARHHAQEWETKKAT